MPLSQPGRVVSWLGQSLFVCLLVCVLFLFTSFAQPGHCPDEPVGMVGGDFGPRQTVCCSIWMLFNECICGFVRGRRVD